MSNRDLDRVSDLRFLLKVEGRKARLSHDPRAGLKHARVASRLARAAIIEGSSEGATPKQLTAEQRSLLVRASTVLGGAHRAAGMLAESEDAYQDALQIAEHGIPPIERAKLNHRLAVLRADQRRFSEAEALCKGAIETYRASGDQESLAMAYSCLGLVYKEAGRFAEAIESCGRVLANPAATPRAYNAAIFNLAGSLTETNDHQALESAGRWIARARRAIRNQRRSLLRHKLSMIEGRLCLRLALGRHAERLFWRARQGFLKLGAPFEIAMVALELSVPLHQEGRWSELEELAADTWKRFRLLSADTQAIAALSVWMDAVQMKKLDECLISESRTKLQGRLVRQPADGRK